MKKFKERYTFNKNKDIKTKELEWNTDTGKIRIKLPRFETKTEKGETRRTKENENTIYLVNWNRIR
jgi:hypothetical protein